MTAALKGSKEIAFTIVSMTLSLAAVFIPVLFMGGIVGRLLNEFAVTIGVAILVSGFVSLTLTPMLAARFLHPPRTASHGRMYMAIERVFVASTRRLRLGAAAGDDAPRRHDGRLGAAPRRDRLLLPHHSDGLHPEPGHRPAAGPDRSGAGHGLRVPDGAPAGDHPADSRGSERPVRDLDDRRRRAWRQRDRRPRVDRAQTARATGAHAPTR